MPNTLYNFFPFSDVVCSLHFDEKCFSLESQQDDEVIFFTKKLKENAIPTLNLPNIRDVEEKIVIVPHNFPNVETTQNAALSPSQLQETNIQTDFIKQNKYAIVRTKAQLNEMKEANVRLQKQITEMEKDLAKQSKIFSEKLKEQYEVRTQLKKYAQNAFSEQSTKAILSKVFSPTQIKVLLGRKKTYWSDHDMAVAYTIRHLSNISCYNYLMRNMNIPLPGLSSIKRWINVKNLGKKRPKKKGNDDDPDNSNNQDLEEIKGESEQCSDQNDGYSQENDEFMEEMVEEIE